MPTFEDFSSVWQGKVEHFLAAEAPAKKRRVSTSGRQKVPTERLPSQHWILDVNNAIAKGLGMNLTVFTDQADLISNPLSGTPRSLWLCTDQEATQRAAASYLRSHSGLWLVHLPDPGHRHHNDLVGALSSSGLLKQAVWSCGVYNAQFGPWSKGGFCAKTREMAAHLSSNCSANDPLLLHFWPLIMKDRNLPESENCESSRAAFLAGLEQQNFARSKGRR